MFKRIMASLLWFYAAATLSNLLATTLGHPPIVNVVVGAAVAATVWLDPLGWLWVRPAVDRQTLVSVTTAPPSVRAEA